MENRTDANHDSETPLGENKFDMNEEYLNDMEDDRESLLTIDDITTHEMSQRVRSPSLSQSQGLLSRVSGDDIVQIAELIRKLDKSREKKPNILNNTSVENNFNSHSVGRNPYDLMALRAAAEHIPTFDGTNISINKFIRECKYAEEQTPAGMRCMLLKHVLKKVKGDAELYITHMQIDSLQDLLDALKRAFAIAEDLSSLYIDVASLEQSENESIHAYSSRARKYLAKMIEIARNQSPAIALQSKIEEHDRHVANSFIRGLIPKLELRVKLQEPKTLQTAVDFALEAEHYVFRLRKRERDDTPTQQNTHTHNKDSNTSEPSVKKPRHVFNIDSQKKPHKKVKCFTCNEEGHISRNCSQKQQNNKNNGNNDNKNKSDNYSGKNNNYQQNNTNNNHTNNSGNNNNKEHNNSRTIDTCDFCTKKGHSTSRCYLKKIDDLQKLCSSLQEKSDAFLNLQNVHNKSTAVNTPKTNQ